MPKFSADNLNVVATEAFFDDKTKTKVVENPNLLQYESQHFRCKVQVELSEGNADHNWSLGLIQACSKMVLENKYGTAGSSFWEFHPLKSGRHKMVNDSDGRQYPFYSLTSSKCEIRRGPVHESTVTLQYEDHFYPTVAWELPYCGGVQLTDVFRKQTFWVWLVAIKRTHFQDNSCGDVVRVTDEQVFILKSLRWSYNLHMVFDPKATQCNKLKKINDIQREEPDIFETPKPIPTSAVNPPHCNAAQSLIWYPKNVSEKPKILVPPKQIIVPWDTWVSDMLTGRTQTIWRPRDCKVVTEWKNDPDVTALRASRHLKVRACSSEHLKYTPMNRLSTHKTHRCKGQVVT